MARHRYELWGESLREIGVLLVVFVPLEMLLQPNAPPRWTNMVIFAGVGFILIWFGIWIEASEK
jgi:hypothetical protein